MRKATLLKGLLLLKELSTEVDTKGQRNWSGEYGYRNWVYLVRDGSDIVEAETKGKCTMMERLYSSAEISSTTC